MEATIRYENRTGLGLTPILTLTVDEQAVDILLLDSEAEALQAIGITVRP